MHKDKNIGLGQSVELLFEPVELFIAQVPIGSFRIKANESRVAVIKREVGFSPELGVNSRAWFVPEIVIPRNMEDWRIQACCRFPISSPLIAGLGFVRGMAVNHVS